MREVMLEVMQEMEYYLMQEMIDYSMQEMTYFGQLTDGLPDVSAFLLAHFKALPRYNPRISGIPGAAAPRQLPLLGELAPGSANVASLGYLHHPGTEEMVKTITHWIVTDVATQARRSVPETSLNFRFL
jgi:hypothetical protein